MSEAAPEISVQALAEQVAAVKTEVEKLHSKHDSHVETAADLTQELREYRRSNASRVGLPGAPAHLAIGTVTLLPPGSQPTVRIEGAAPSYVLHFGIPAAGEVRLRETNGKIHIIANDQNVAELAPVSKQQLVEALADAIKDEAVLRPIVDAAVRMIHQENYEYWLKVKAEMDAGKNLAEAQESVTEQRKAQKAGR